MTEGGKRKKREGEKERQTGGEERKRGTKRWRDARRQRERETKRKRDVEEWTEGSKLKNHLPARQKERNRINLLMEARLTIKILAHTSPLLLSLR